MSKLKCLQQGWLSFCSEGDDDIIGLVIELLKGCQQLRVLDNTGRMVWQKLGCKLFNVVYQAAISCNLKAGDLDVQAERPWIVMDYALLSHLPSRIMSKSMLIKHFMQGLCPEQSDFVHCARPGTLVRALFAAKYAEKNAIMTFAHWTPIPAHQVPAPPNQQPYQHAMPMQENWHAAAAAPSACSTMATQWS